MLTLFNVHLTITKIQYGALNRMFLFCSSFCIPHYSLPLPYVTFYAKRDHVPELIVGQNSQQLVFCQLWDFRIFVKNYPLPTFLCKMGAPRAFNHPCEAFTFSHSLPSCIAYNGVSIMRHLVTMATETVALNQSKRIPIQICFKRRLTTRMHFFSFKMVLANPPNTLWTKAAGDWWVWPLLER